MNASAFLAGFLILAGVNAYAQQTVRIAQGAWAQLSPTERAAIQKQYIVDLAAPDSYGVIIDNQGADESTPGTTGGAQLGSVVAQASYLDKAIKSGNYSAKNQLALGLLGALLGSSLDSAPTARYHFRYAVKLGNGEIKYFDEIKSEPFRHPAGVCVVVPNVAITEQALCGQTANTLRATYLASQVSDPATNALPVPTYEAAKAEQSAPAPAPATRPESQIMCKLPNLAPVLTNAEKCLLIGGVKINE